MALSTPVVADERHAQHEPAGEVWVGVRIAGTEVPERARRIRAVLADAGARFVEPTAQPESRLLGVHDPALLAYLDTAWERWEEAGLPREPGQDRVVPYLFPHPGLVGSLEPRPATAITAAAGQFAFDTMTLIGPGTATAARGAVEAALTAAELVLGGERAAYALCRPPGHHATRTAFGGSCYLNNAAAAAARLRDEAGGTVGVVDIDAHHGNGTQAIFYDDGRVPTASVHVDPGAGWFPHFLGFAEEKGKGVGRGANLNLPLAPGTGDEGWLAAVERAAEWVAGRGAESLVIALGVDAAGGDPESPLEVSAEGYARAGRLLGELGLPAVLVQEGGYDLGSLGALVRATLEGFERA